MNDHPYAERALGDITALANWVDAYTRAIGRGTAVEVRGTFVSTHVALVFNTFVPVLAFTTVRIGLHRKPALRVLGDDHIEYVVIPSGMFRAKLIP